MRISFRESYCAPFNCLRSLFCCNLPSLVRTKDAPNLAPISDSAANPIPISDSAAVSASVDDESGEGKAGALSVEEVRKSCLKKLDGEKKGNVKWKDLLGKELVEMKEYEPRLIRNPKTMMTETQHAFVPSNNDDANSFFL